MLDLTEAQSHQGGQGEAPVDGGVLESSAHRGQGAERGLDQERVGQVWTCSPESDRK